MTGAGSVGTASGSGGGEDGRLALSGRLLDPANPAKPRTQLYRWNGFGFSGVNDAALNERCRADYAEALSAR